MKRLASLITLLLVFAASVVATAPAARADDHPSWRITRYDAAAIVDKAGVAKVTVDFDFYFGGDAGPRPLCVAARAFQEVREDPGLWRMLDVNLVSGLQHHRGGDGHQGHPRERPHVHPDRDPQPQGPHRHAALRRRLHHQGPGGAEGGGVRHGRTQLERRRTRLGGAAGEDRRRRDQTGARPAGDVLLRQPLLVPVLGPPKWGRPPRSPQRLGKGEGMQVTAGFPTGTFDGCGAALREALLDRQRDAPDAGVRRPDGSCSPPSAWSAWR